MAAIHLFNVKYEELDETLVLLLSKDSIQKSVMSSRCSITSESYLLIETCASKAGGISSYYASSLRTMPEITPPSALPAICFDAIPITLPISFMLVAPT